MSQKNSDVQVDAISGRPTGPDAPAQASRSKRLLWVNWGLALLTVVGAGIVMAVAWGAVMSTAACSNCPNLGPSGISFNEVFYGAPVLAALTIVVSFFTAKRRWGIVVPVSVLALMVVAAAVITATVAQ
ncbi:MAG: hypothetical protein WB777_20465 [Mycobacterium sp.]